MDLRVKRTKTNIMNAFLELREQKPLEKITVKELSDLAVINKATFYTHYKDIYDLASQMENTAVRTVLSRLSHPEYLITKPKRGMMELMAVVARKEKLFQVLFSGTRQSILPELLETQIKKKIFELFPEYQNDLEKEVLLTVMIQGCFHAFMKYRDEDAARVSKILGSISESLVQELSLDQMFENLMK